MNPLIEKLAPTGVVVALVGLCCWPHLTDSEVRLDMQQENDLPQVTQSLLSPDILPAPDRDPFRDMRINSTGGMQEQLATTAGPGTGGGSSEIDIAAELSKLVLNATYVRGDRRVALINGELYALGETLDGSPSGSQTFIVMQISLHKVLLKRQGQTVELSYDMSSQTNLADGALGSGQSVAVPPGIAPTQDNSLKAMQRTP